MSKRHFKKCTIIKLILLVVAIVTLYLVYDYSTVKIRLDSTKTAEIQQLQPLPSKPGKQVNEYN